MKDYNIKWEGVFIDSYDEIQDIIKKVDYDWDQLKHKVTNYHVTTEYDPLNKHYQFYGLKVKIRINGYIIDHQIQNPRYYKLTSAKGFIVNQMETSHKEFQYYLDNIHKKFHITTSYDRLAIDINFADFHKIIPCNFIIGGKFGGYDSTCKQIIYSCY